MPRALRRGTGALAAALCLLPVSGGAEEPEPLRAALSATISLQDAGGTPLASIPPGEPFVIDVAVHNLVGAEPPAGLKLAGWIRRVSVHNLSCLQAARSYFATGGLPTDAISLNGPVIGVLTDDRALNVVDPFINLASANLIGATIFPEMPAALVAQPDAARFLASLPEAGELQAISVFGGQRRVLAAGLQGPGQVIAAGNGGIWLHEEAAQRAVRFDADGNEEAGFAAIGLRGGSNTVLLPQADGGVLVLDADDGRLLARLDPDAGSQAETVLNGPDGAFAVARIVEGETLALHYLDAAETPQRIALAAPATHLEVDPLGRFVFAWSPQGGPVSVVDIARGHVAQAVGAAGTTVSEIALTQTGAFLMLADQSMVGAIRLASVRIGEEAAIRQIPLGTRRGDPVGGPGFLMPLQPRPEILAIHAETYTGFILHENTSLGDAPPMGAVRLRGGNPARAVVLDRGFQEVATARFRAGAILPEPGSYELVLSTGIGGLTVCHPLPGEVAAELPAGPGRIIAEVQREEAASGRQARRVSLTFANAAADPVAGLTGLLTVSALETGWTRRLRIAVAAPPQDSVTLELPPLGAFVLTLLSADGQDFPPVILEVHP